MCLQASTPLSEDKRDLSKALGQCASVRVSSLNGSQWLEAEEEDTEAGIIPALQVGAWHSRRFC